MKFFQIASGGDRNYGYIVACDDTGKAVVVDPSPDPDPCFEKVGDLNTRVEYIINTHSHSDHSSGNNLFQDTFHAPVIGWATTLPDGRTISDESRITVGGITLRIIHTPGHTADSICVLVEQELITGDTLFVGKVGGTYSRTDAQAEFESLKKLMKLDGHTRVWPGHNYGVRPSSTIAEEKTGNPFCLRLNDFNEFLWLKDHWAAYKMEHNID